MEIIEGIEVPDNKTELDKATKFISRVSKKVNNHLLSLKLPKDEFIELYQEILRVLFNVGELSEPIFEIQDKLEEKYNLAYSHSPALATKLFWEKYSDAHKPYTILKNRCYTLLDNLEELYTDIYSEPPIYFWK